MLSYVAMTLVLQLQPPFAALAELLPPTPVLPPPSTEFCIADDGRNVSCGPATSQHCMPQPIWPRPIFHVMDFWCGENDPNGPYVSEHGMYHLFCELAEQPSRTLAATASRCPLPTSRVSCHAMPQS